MRKFFVALMCVMSLWVALETRGEVSPATDAAKETPEPTSNPPVMTDSIRGAVGNIMTLMNVGDEPELGATLNVIQAEVGALMDGSETKVVDTGTGEGDCSQVISISSYDYVKKNVLDNNLKTPYSKLNGKLKFEVKTDPKTKAKSYTVTGAESAIKELFFIADDNKATEAKKAEIVQHRNEYLKKVGKAYSELAYNVQKRLIDDMSAISADIDGRGSINAVSGTDQTWRAVNKALIADIALQIQMMEVEAAKFLYVQPEVIMTAKEGGKS